MPFAISQLESDFRMSQNVTAQLALHHKYKLGTVGEIYYNKHTNEWGFIPTTQTEQSVHRVGQKQSK